MHYLWLSVLYILSAVLLADLATIPAPLWGDIRVKHTWNTVPANWEGLGPPPAGTVLDLHIALKPHRENALIDALYEVSDPGHQKYRAHLSKEQVADLVAPHENTLEIVHSWLEHHGVPSSSISTSHGGGWLTISGVPVSQADKFLCASYQLYRHAGTNETDAILRTVSYAIPAALHAHVQTIAPTTHFASPRTSLQTPRKSFIEAAVMVNATSGEPGRVLSAMRDDVVKPSYLRWLYGTQPYVPAAAQVGQNVLGILGFQEGQPTQADLTQFMTTYRPDAAAATFTVVEVNGGEDDSWHTGPATSINTQYATAMIYPIPLVFYNAGSEFQWLTDSGRLASGDVYLNWFNYLTSRPNHDIPLTISIPYFDPEPLFPMEYAMAVCNLFAQLGARGVSVLTGSGDDGVGLGNCKDDSGNVKFIPMFPASCPWVTTVGGTTGHDHEIAADLSGGGFSHYFSRPPYQGHVIPDFLDFLGTTYAGQFNPGGRGIPDIAAQAQRFVYISDADPRITSSTGCSTVTVAGIVSLLNDYLLANGESPLGFLNPLLYGYGRYGINDIAYGYNPGCGTAGFLAISGWDPVTGLGSLVFEILLSILKYWDYEVEVVVSDSRPGHSGENGT